MQRAIKIAWDAFGLEPLTEIVRWAQEYEPSAFEGHALQAYVGPDGSYARQAVAGLEAVDGFWPKVTYATSLLFPTREYVRARDGSYARRAARALRLLQDDSSRRHPGP